MQTMCQIFSGVIKEMGVIEPDDMTARLFTTENSMATGEVVKDIVKNGGVESILLEMLKKFQNKNEDIKPQIQRKIYLPRWLPTPMRSLSISRKMSPRGKPYKNITRELHKKAF